MAKYAKIQDQISGQRLEVGASDFQVDILSYMASIGRDVSRGCRIWLTLSTKVNGQKFWILKTVTRQYLLHMHYVKDSNDI